MPLQYFYWIVMTIWLVLGIYRGVRATDRWGIPGDVLLFILFVIIGMRIFGNPVQ